MRMTEKQLKALGVDLGRIATATSDGKQTGLQRAIQAAVKKEDARRGVSSRSAFHKASVAGLAQTEDFSVEFDIEGLPYTTNSARGSHAHWSCRHKEDAGWKRAVWVEVMKNGKPRQPLQKATITLTRFSSNEPDFEGLVSSFKPVLDGLIEAGVILDDHPSVIGQPVYLWERCKAGSGKIRIQVRSVLDDPKKNGDMQ